MSKVKTALLNAKTKMMMRMVGVKSEEKGDHLLEVLGTIIIAVVILILFKDAIVNIFNSALGNTTTSVNNLFAAPTAP